MITIPFTVWYGLMLAAHADSSGGAQPSQDSWVITGEFAEVDTGNRAMQAGVGRRRAQVNCRFV